MAKQKPTAPSTAEGVTFSTGGKRSERKPRYDLIPKEALVRLSARYEMGLKYGEHNYKLGLPFDDTFNHIIDHLLSYKERRKAYFQAVSEEDTHLTLDEWMTTRETDGDDLAGAAWGIFTIMHLEMSGRLG